ncbi:MAG: hypothetical protein IKL57_07300 [Oscillospiraceae bacterium]|nr:hypothetical protein [Oscillospiraceae bacterium]MBR3611243.1 hypothetical protein [Oscillospiraceae bacterium]
MSYSGRNNIYDSIIKKMVTKALEEKEQEFEEAHKDDSDEQLLQYIKESAEILHHVPWQREIVGGSYIEKRFGTYKAALRAAELPNPKHPDLIEKFPRIQKEIETQKAAYRKNKAEKKERSAKRKAEQAEKRRQRMKYQADKSKNHA